MKINLPQIYRNPSAIHRYGIYAKEPIRKGQYIVEYKGKKITKSHSEKSKSHYIFTLNKRYDVLGQNIAKYINHSCQPNCEAIIVDNSQIWIEALRKIAPHEELTYNYGYALDEDPAVCNCKRRICKGFILDTDHW